MSRITTGPTPYEIRNVTMRVCGSDVTHAAANPLLASPLQMLQIKAKACGQSLHFLRSSHRAEDRLDWPWVFDERQAIAHNANGPAGDILGHIRARKVTTEDIFWLAGGGGRGAALTNHAQRGSAGQPRGTVAVIRVSAPGQIALARTPYFRHIARHGTRQTRIPALAAE